MTRPSRANRWWLDAADAQVSPQARSRLRSWAGGPSDRAWPRACAKASGVAGGEPLSAGLYESWASERTGMPSRAVLVRRFGSWATAVEAAGFRPAVKPRRAYRRLSHTDAVATVGAFVLQKRSSRTA
jgi:hypothetical protein